MVFEATVSPSETVQVMPFLRRELPFRTDRCFCVNLLWRVYAKKVKGLDHQTKSQLGMVQNRPFSGNRAGRARKSAQRERSRGADRMMARAAHSGGLSRRGRSTRCRRSDGRSGSRWRYR